MSVSDMTMEYCIYFFNQRNALSSAMTVCLLLSGLTKDIFPVKVLLFNRISSSADRQLSSPKEVHSRPAEPTLDVLKELSGVYERGFSLCTRQKSKDIPDPDGRSYQVARGYTHIQRALQACKCKGPSYLQRDPHDSAWPLRLMEEYPMRGPSRPKVHLPKSRGFQRTP